MRFSSLSPGHSVMVSLLLCHCAVFTWLF